jgi:hypothetical protein
MKNENKQRVPPGLTNDQKIALRDMGSIRDKQEAPGRNRLADFKEQENAAEHMRADPLLLVGGQLKVEGRTIYTHQDLIDALVMLAANQHQFELYYNDDPRIPIAQDLREPKEPGALPDDLRAYEDRDAVEARIARDPDFWDEDMRPLNDDDMDRVRDDDNFSPDEPDIDR